MYSCKLINCSSVKDGDNNTFFNTMFISSYVFAYITYIETLNSLHILEYLSMENQPENI